MSIANFSIFDSKVPGLVSQTAKQWEQENESYYKAISLLKNCVYLDDWADVLYEYIRQVFSNEAERTQVLKQMSMAVNTLREYVDTISKVYNSKCSRSFPINGTVDAIDQNAIDVYAGIKNIDRAMQSFNKRCNLHNTALMYVRYCEEKEQIQLKIFDRSSCELKWNDAEQEIEEFKFQQMMEVEGYEMPVLCDVVWTDDYHDVKCGNKSIIEDNPDKVNPYGIIPAVPVQMELVDNFWNTMRNSGLTGLTLDEGLKTTILQFQWLFNSFRQLAIVGGEVASNTVLGPNRIMTIKDASKTDVQPTLSTLDMVVDQQGMVAGMEQIIRLALKSTGINWIDSLSSDQSGELVKQKKRSEGDIIQSQIQIFEPFEAELFNVIRTIWNTHNPGKRINDNTEISCIFNQAFANVSVDELAFDKQKLENGLLSPVQFFMKYNPGIKDPVKAEELLRLNMQLFSDIFGVSKIGGTFQSRESNPWA